jgi:hypothetical protein
MSMMIGVFALVPALWPGREIDVQLALDHLRTGAGHEEEHQHEYDVDHRRDLKTDIPII